MEALEVFALTSDMQRATGSIPYTSLMWDRKYYEPGSFLMELPANVYDPSWAYIYTDERPETGIIQKVEYSDTATTAGGVDTVILSGFFLEHELNRYTFLAEETEEEAYRIYKPAPAKTVKPTLWQAEGGQTYVKHESLGSPTRWETLEGDYVDPAKLDTTGLTEIELGAGEGLKLCEYETTNLDRFPTGFWTANEYTNENYSYYSEDGKTLHSVAPDGTEKTFDIVRGGTGDVIYEDSDGSLKWVNGVASSLGGTYVRARDSWESMVKSEGLEVVTGDGTIMGGSTYARAYRTVKGPWQLRTDLDVNEPADNVQRIIQWAQDIWGNNLLYDEVGFAGEEKIIDPSLKLFGDLAYEELKTIGASPRLSYSFESDTCVFEIWRGLDRTQSQAGVPAPPTPDEPEPDEPTIDELYEAVDYIQSDGGAYIDTGFKQNQDTRIVMHAKQTTSPSAFTWAFEGRDSNTSGANGVLWFYSEGVWKSDHAGNADRLDLSGVGVNDDLYIDKNKNVCTVNGVTVTHTAKTYQSNTNLVLMACNTSGEISGYMAGRLYYTQIYDNGTLVRNLMPYRRKADGVFGMLDLVNEVFYESASGVPFAGPSYPAGTYEELEYIASTGVQWIDTGVYPNQSTRLVMDARFTHLPTDVQSALFGARVSNTNQFWMYYRYNDDQLAWRYANKATNNLLDVDLTTGKTIDANANVLTVGGSSVTAVEGTFTSAYPMFLFAVNAAGSAQYPCNAAISNCRIYGDGTTLDRDFVPRRRVSDGAVGLLDLVYGVFYESAGSEPFLAPGELPSGYTRLEYIEGTGSQYFDTGVAGTLPLEASFDIKTNANISAYDGIFLGAVGGGAHLYPIYLFQGIWYMGAGSSAVNSGSGHMSNSTRYSVNVSMKSGSQTFSVNGSTLMTSAAVTSGTTYNLYLFAYNNNGSASHHWSGLCYGGSITQGGTLVRDYVPVKNGSGVAGLFDMVTMSFYVDASGTGFVAGPEVAQVAAVAEASTFSLMRTVAASDETTEAANPFAVFSDTWGTLYGFTASRDVSNYRNTCYVLYQFRDKTDADGNPIGPRGFIKARLEDELPDAETYLDLRGEEPEDGQTDEAFIESLRQRGLAHLQANYAAIESLDTGTLAGNGYLDGYDLGDKVDMLVEAIGLVKEARITGVCEVHEAGSSTATLEIGEQKLTNIRKAVIV